MPAHRDFTKVPIHVRRKLLQEHFFCRSIMLFTMSDLLKELKLQKYEFNLDTYTYKPFYRDKQDEGVCMTIMSWTGSIELDSFEDPDELVQCAVLSMLDAEDRLPEDINAS